VCRCGRGALVVDPNQVESCSAQGWNQMDDAELADLESLVLVVLISWTHSARYIGSTSMDSTRSGRNGFIVSRGSQASSSVLPSANTIGSPLKSQKQLVNHCFWLQLLLFIVDWFSYYRITWRSLFEFIINSRLVPSH
jgi:hypothetical protein